MSTAKIADRAFVAINGFEAVLLKTAELSIEENLQRVDTMTRNYRSAGYKNGNRHIRLKLGFEMDSHKAQIDLALADPTADVNVVYICGGERYTASGLRQSRLSLSASTGDASKTLELEALDCTNENGTSVNSDLSLG